MQPHEIAEHLATTLRHTIGPAVADPFARTQAFMASVVLEKLAGQLRLAEADQRAARTEALALSDDLRALDVAPTAVRFLAAVRRLDTGSDAEMSHLVACVHADRTELGERFDHVLARVRRTVRANLDRQMAYCA